ncbi:MAG: hypothetical protein LAQ69_34155 [Acidobacteriia bacterium]|nr:hypothetical protein [Terriglobia bacterium]
MAGILKGSNVERDAADRITATLREIPFLATATIRRESVRGDSRIDFVLTIRSQAIDRRIVCEVKSSGQPRSAREACLILRDYARSDNGAYPVFVAPYIAPAAAAICDQYEVGYFDLAGNCRIAFDQIYIRRDRFPNPTVQKRDLRSLYSPKAERILRVLLTGGKRSWRMQELADESKVSLGQVANVKKLLADREWIQTEADGFRLRPYDEAALPMLTEWAANYRAERSMPGEYYSLDPIPQAEAEIVSASRQLNAQIAFSGFSGAARFAPAVRYQRVSAYILGDVSALVARLRLKPVSSGANVTLIEPYDEGVFYGAKEIESAPVVSPVQLYLDLTQTKGRGEEAASAVLEEVIKTAWL